MLERETRVLELAVREAGQEIVRIAREGFETTFKANEDPLTTADLTANTILRTKISEAFPDDAWLSEESADDLERCNCRRVWIVDPIDGTREFVKALPEFAISVALVEDGLPIVGAIYNPMTDEYFQAVKGQGSFLNGQRTRVRQASEGRISVFGSRSEIKRGEFEPFAGILDVQPLGSVAYKLARVSAGAADATFSLTPKNEWDIAAGVLLVEEAGGFVVDKDFEPFRFNREQTLVPGIIATSMHCKDQLIEHIEQHLGHR
ncbi:3'(2'),5'-bisphosphate nucleotidase CysQ [Alicyclobacillus fastidiosus]|uniref:inositol-phosphate phosphatase n=1 Tax=Alicyclobacillus fastidiosus TaxID=392011 RepID=A0ABV5AD53_9BACL|nr:3'(2'),5'-bisphosphate nucleotidase CysQ [Alicyclobacillus fastidiosus]WEH08774.1 3'(2'),5'-bisphosphate nucleotidase CysQ [Alicyclobacillus fastidiosus]